MAPQELIYPKEPINAEHSFQLFLAYNNLCNTFNWKNQQHFNAWKDWQRVVKTFKPFRCMSISTSNAGFNHY
jgi:hypothetical protein